MPVEILNRRPVPQEQAAHPPRAESTGLRVVGRRPIGEPDADPEWSDYGRQAMSTLATMGAGLGWLGQKLGEKTGVRWLEGGGRSLKEVGRRASDAWINERLDVIGITQEGLSPAARRAMETDFLGDASFGDKWNKAKLLAVGSLPATMGGLGAGGLIARGLGATGMGAGWAAAIGYGLGEAGIAAPMSGEAVEREIEAMTHDQLIQSDEYRATFDALEGLPPAERFQKAKEVVAAAASGNAAALTMVSTFALSAPAGAILRKFVPGAQVATGRVLGSLKGAGTEAVQEFFQSATEAMSQNQAMRAAGFDREIWDGVLEEAVGGALSGAMLGGPVGFVAPGQDIPPRKPEDRLVREGEPIDEPEDIGPIDIPTGAVEAETVLGDEEGGLSAESGTTDVADESPTIPNLRVLDARKVEESAASEAVQAPPGTSAREQATPPPSPYEPGERIKRSQQVADPRADSVLEWLSKTRGHDRATGGISVEDAIAQGFDPADLNAAAGHGIRRPFTKGGMTFDQAAELLDEAGYPVRDAQGRYDANIVADLISRELAGEKVFSSRNEQALAAEYRRQAERAIRDDDDLPKAYFDDLVPAEAQREDVEDLMRLNDLTIRASQYADESDVEWALEALSDEEAERRLIDLIDRGRSRERENERQEQPEQGSREPEEAQKPGPVPAQAPAAEEADLLGEDVRQPQALADERRRRDAARSPNRDVSIETGDPSDLFSESRRNLDIEDVAREQQTKEARQDLAARREGARAEGAGGEARSSSREVSTQEGGSVAEVEAVRDYARSVVDAAVTDRINRAIRDFAMEQQGQSILDDLEEAGTSPRDVATQFWRSTYPRLNGGTQRRFRRYVERLSGFKPGDTVGTNADGSPVVAETPLDLADFVNEDLAGETQHLQDIERGYVAMMAWANQQADAKSEVDRHVNLTSVADQRGPGEQELTKQPREPDGELIDSAAQEIVEAMLAADDSFAEWGLRVIPSDMDINPQQADVLPPSYRWDDGVRTNDELDGSSAIAIRNQTIEAVRAAIEAIGAGGRRNGFYEGDRVALLRSDSARGGEDVGEIVMRDAEVVGIWKKAGPGNDPILPNRPKSPGAQGRVPSQKDIDAAAHEAATSPKNDRPQPTQAQKEANGEGNYRLGDPVKLYGVTWRVENPKGSYRFKFDEQRFRSIMEGRGDARTDRVLSLLLEGKVPDAFAIVEEMRFGYKGGTKVRVGLRKLLEVAWHNKMPAHYARAVEIEGADGDKLDAFLGPKSADQSLPVHVIDTQRLDGKGFDEHKVMIGFESAEAGEAAFRGSYDAAIYEKIKGQMTTMHPAEFETWAKSESKKPAAEAVSESKETGTKIEDFGEVLEGARKHAWEAYRDRLGEAGDVAAEPLSKSWPEPDYQKLIEEGADPWTVAFIHAARDEIQPKPRKGWKIRQWVEQTTALREFARGVLSGNTTKAQIMEALSRPEFSRLATVMRGRIDLYMAVGHEKSLKGVRLSSAQYSMIGGQKIDPPRVIWAIERKAKATAFSNWPTMLAKGDTREQAIANFKRDYAGIETQPVASKQIAFSIYSYRTGLKAGKWIIGKKIGKDRADLKEFDSVKEARAYLNAHQADLEKALEQYKNIPDHRKESNAPRVGHDYRNEADVTPDLFSETFGFRGVQFGNYVEGKRRQQDLNRAYDALLDLAGVLNVPPKALSLNGDLGLAFGARGKGGKGAAAAHFEPDTVVINLTKREGPGSLAHEWFHALDNYFSRRRGRSTGFMTVSIGDRTEGVRPEVAQSFEDVIRAIRQTGLQERSKGLDRRRTNAYWSTGEEMAARAFESYVVAKLQDQSQSNDYLANIVSEDYWKAAAALGVGEGTEAQPDYPYPTAAEIPVIRAAFDSLFEIIETKETDLGVLLFALEPQRGTRKAGLSVKEIETHIGKIVERWHGMQARVVVANRKSLSKVPEAVRQGIERLDPSGRMMGLNHRSWRTIYLFADNIQTLKEAERILIHEAKGHAGVEAFLGDQYALFRDLAFREFPKLAVEQARHIGADVRTVEGRNRVGDEIIATIAERIEARTATAKMLRFWDSLVQAIRRFVSNVLGFEHYRPTKSELRNVIREAARRVETGPPAPGQTQEGLAAAVAPDPSTDAFKRWFGDSKVVDQNGEPLVVYHGTRDRITAFDPRKLGSRESAFFFSANKDSAREYGDNLIPVYLKADRFIDLDADYRDSNGQAHNVDSPEFRARFDGYSIDKGKRWNEYVVFRPEQIKSATGNRGTFDPNNPDITAALTDPDNETNLNAALAGEAKRRTEAVLNMIGKGQPIDRAFSALSIPFGTVDESREFHVRPGIKKTVRRSMDEAQRIVKSKRFRFLSGPIMRAHNTLNDRYNVDEGAKKALLATKRGLIDRFGQTKEMKARFREREADYRSFLLQGEAVLKTLLESGVESKEAAILYRLMVADEMTDAEMASLSDDVLKLAPEIQETIASISREYVELGFMNEATYQRWNGQYLPRSYKRYEANQSTLGRSFGRVLDARRKRLHAQQFRGRGMKIVKSQERILRDVPESWWGRAKKTKKADPSLIGRKFVVLDRIAADGSPEALPGIDAAKIKGRILSRVYWPTDLSIPKAYGGLENRGTFEVRDTVGGDLLLWRDFTREERDRMGEVVDARYAITKFFMQAAHDISSGRLFRDIARNPEWTQDNDPIGDSPNGSEITGWVTSAEWVRVPETKAPGTQVSRYGALAGKYIRAEIWLDIAQTQRMQRSNFWRQMMTYWKLSKTALNLVVHTNNIMSNFLFADLADIRTQDFVRGVFEYFEEGEHYQNMKRLGAFGHDLMSQEIKKNTLQPILDELNAEDAKKVAKTQAGLPKIMGRISALVWKGHLKMIDAYRMEDEIFRTAMYMREISNGKSPEDAAASALEQFLDYDIRAPWVNAARATFLPFIAYTYRAVPVIAKSIAARPWKLAKYATISYAMNMLAYLVMDDDDEDEQRATLRENERGRTWVGVHRMLRSPMNDRWGNPMFLDIRRWIPAGDVFDTHQGSSAIPYVPAPLMPGGPIAIGAELFLNRASFTGEPIYDELTDTKGEQAAAVAGFLYKSFIPNAPWAPGSWYWDKIKGAATGELDAMMREYNVPLAIASSIGIKLRPHDVDLNRRYLMMQLDQVDQALGAELSALSRDLSRNRIDREFFDERLAEINRKRLRIVEQRAELAPR